jgi:hypothetical protein
MRAHQNNAIAVNYGMGAAHIVHRIIHGSSIRDALAWALGPGNVCMCVCVCCVCVRVCTHTYTCIIAPVMYMHIYTNTRTRTHTESPLDPEVKESAQTAAEFGANKTCQEAVFFF